MQKNLELLRHSLLVLEDFTDKFYEKDNVVIPRGRKRGNRLIGLNRRVLQLLENYQVATKKKNLIEQAGVIRRLITTLTNKSINHSEFVNFWKVYDVSYSVFKKLPNDLKETFLHKIIPKYLDKRHPIYLSHGYSATTLQVVADSFAHKRSGSLGIKKITTLLVNAGFNHFEGVGMTEFVNQSRVYILPDVTGDDKAIFRDLIKRNILLFPWGRSKQGKNPDCVFKLRKHYYIVEHKHMKESGGGQDKQMVELIDFIRQGEKSASYVSFLDGIYFNFFALGKLPAKIQEQSNQINQILNEQQDNYFVNTTGFKQLLKTIA